MGARLPDGVLAVHQRLQTEAAILLSSASGILFCSIGFLNCLVSLTPSAVVCKNQEQDRANVGHINIAVQVCVLHE